MKHNVNISYSLGVIPRVYPDKKVISCPVDNFPVDNPAYRKRDGFRCNDVSLLDRLSFDLSFDPDLARIIASRVKEMPSDSQSNMTEEQLVRTMRPSWCQTASEMKRYDEQVYQYLTTTADVSLEDVKAAASSPVADASDVGSDVSKNTDE